MITPYKMINEIKQYGIDIIAKNFSYIFLLNIFQQATSFGCFFYIIHQVPKDVIGDYHFVLSILSLVNFFSLPGMSGAVLQAIARKEYGFFKIASKYALLCSFSGSIILLGFAAYFFVYGTIFMSISFCVAALLNPAFNGMKLWKSSMQGKEQFMGLAIRSAGIIFSTNILILCSTFIYSETSVLMLSVAVLLPAIQNIMYAIHEHNTLSHTSEYDHEMVGYGFKTTAYQAFPIIAYEIDKLSVYNFISAGDLAVYNVALKIPNMLKGVVQDLGQVLMPRLARASKFTAKLDQTLWIFSIISSLGIIIFTFTLFPILFNLIVPDGYSNATTYTQFLLCTIPLANHIVIRSQYIRAQKDSESVKWLSLLTGMIKIIFTPIAVYFYGVYGALGVILVQRLFMSIATEVILQRKYKSAPE